MAALVDTHAHLCDAAFDPDLPVVLERARAAGISAILSVGENLTDAEKNLELAARYPMIRPAAGLYPSELDLERAEQMRAFIRTRRDKLAAIGEVGLDYWIVQKEADREIQREIFRRFIDLSVELGLPLNVHSRSAGRHAVEVLLQSGAVKVQLHAFDGRPAAAMPGVEAGFFFSIPPSVARSVQKQNLVRKLPLASLLVETDSPVLGPSAGERNEPRNATVAARWIADLKGIREAEAAEALAVNTMRLYGESLS